MKKKALLIAVVAIALAVVTAASVTVAWLTSKSEVVENTFTVGKIEIHLAETTGTTGYKVVPGGRDDKDPTVTVVAGSEMCYVYVLVENNLVIGSTVVGTPNIDTNNWKEVKTDGNKTLYRYVSEVDASSAAKTLPVFTEVTYDGDAITSENITSLDGKKIIVSAFAHQSINLTNIDTANNAAIAWAFPAA